MSSAESTRSNAQPQPAAWSVRLSLRTAFSPTEVVPYVADAFNSMYGSDHSFHWRNGVFELRAQRTPPGGHTIDFELRVTPRLDGGSYVRLHERNIPDAATRSWRLRELQTSLNELNQVLVEAARLRARTRQAVIVVHGIGEQLPGQTLRSFTSSVFTRRPSKTESGNECADRPFVKPDYISSLFELRTMRIPPDKLTGTPATDVYEFYWAHLICDTTLGQVYGWLARLLLAPKANIPPALRRHFWAVRVLLAAAAAAIGWLVYSRTGRLWSAAMTAGALAAIPAIAWAVLRLARNRFLLGFLGDAARYLEPRPGNIERRQAIREAGIGLVDELHDSGNYSRIMVFGHSLGSVIAYDILRLAWIRRYRKNDCVNVMNSRELLRLEDLLNPRGEERDGTQIEIVQARQRAAWEEYRRNGFKWLVSDFVTAGSPLTSARLLLNLDKRTTFDGLVADRSFPTCPPQAETVRAPRPGQDRKRFTFTHAYRVSASSSRSRSVQIPHHAGLFALTRWTNLYFPFRGVINGDPIGGPLRATFGGWIKDVALPHPGGGFLGFAHSLYWCRRGTNDHLRLLREALALPFHGNLDELISELYAHRERGSFTQPSERRESLLVDAPNPQGPPALQLGNKAETQKSRNSEATGGRQYFNGGE